MLLYLVVFVTYSVGIGQAEILQIGLNLINSTVDSPALSDTIILIIQIDLKRRKLKATLHALPVYKKILEISLRRKL